MASLSLRAILVTVLAAICVSIFVPRVSAITCAQVLGDVSGCLGYARSGGNVPPGCCAGVGQLINSAKTTPDRQQACSCLKSIANSIPGINMAFVSGIPDKCSIKVPFPLALSTDCSKVH